MAKIIDGNAIAEAIRAEVMEETEAFRKTHGHPPGLATVLVGNDPASEVYVRMKNRDAERVGFYSRQITLPADTPEEELLGVVEGQRDPTIHDPGSSRPCGSTRTGSSARSSTQGRTASIP